MRELGPNAFRGWVNLREVLLPRYSVLEYIGPCVFAGTALTSFVSPPCLRKIAAGAFSGCMCLRTVRLNEGVQVLEDGWLGVFQNSGIEEVYIPSTLKYVGSNTFLNCFNLRRVYVMRGCRVDVRRYIGMARLIYVGAPNNWHENPLSGVDTISGMRVPQSTDSHGPPTLMIPAGTTVICAEQFQNKDAKKVCIPNSVMEIREGAFKGWKDLREVVFETGSQLRVIGDCAFSESGITFMEMPASLRDIGMNAFLGCADLRSVRLNDGLETLG